MERKAGKAERKRSQAKGCKGEGSNKQDILSCISEGDVEGRNRVCNKNERRKEPTLYKTYISLVINHVGVVDTSVWDTTVNDVWQMIRDKKCTYITREDDEESEEEDLIGA